jgi:putative flippase GtrA
MTVHQLRRWSDQAGSSLKNGGEIARSGLNTAYSKAMNHPKTATAVLLGTGVAAALLWLANRNGTFRAKRKETLERVRKPARSSKARRAATG